MTLRRLAAIALPAGIAGLALGMALVVAGVIVPGLFMPGIWLLVAAFLLLAAHGVVRAAP